MFDDPFIAQMAQDPIFIWEYGQWNATDKPKQLRRKTSKLIIGIMAIELGLWVLGAMSQLAACNSPYCNYSKLIFSDSAGIVFCIVIGLGLASSLITDFFYFIFPIVELRKPNVTTELDLLRLTPLEESRIIQAKFAVLQMRIAPVANVEWALRICTVIVTSIPLVLCVPALIFLVVCAIFGLHEITKRAKFLIALGVMVGTSYQRYPLMGGLGLTIIAIMHLAWIILPLMLFITFQTAANLIIDLGIACLFFGFVMLFVQLIWVFPVGEQLFLNRATQNLQAN